LKTPRTPNVISYYGIDVGEDRFSYSGTKTYIQFKKGYLQGRFSWKKTREKDLPVENLEMDSFEWGIPEIHSENNVVSNFLA